MPTNKALMVQGCTSDAGKSILVAGLCRLLQRRGLSVAPFKPQNMALNSAVTEDGGEIGRAQALQAQAAKVPLSVHMNPVLLKPSSDTGAQVIIQGHSIGNLEATNYHDYKPKAAQAVFDSFQILNDQYPILVVEGAGSPAEINLRKGDIANMGFAEKVDCPVILIADIDKGGVFAHLIGTLECLSESERNRIQGFVINKFRGDIALLQDGLDWLEAKTNKPVIGVLPYLHGFHIDSEDAIQSHVNKSSEAFFKVICPLLPHISNHTDLDPFMLHPNIQFEFIKHDQPIPPADLIILPGSKNIAFDLDWLRQQAWPAHIEKHLRYNGKIIGICGGLQMLGKTILDPLAIESNRAKLPALGLMPYATTLQKQKQLVNQTGQINLENPVPVKGYEIHQGTTSFGKLKPAITLQNQQPEGAISDDNQILVSYLHGLFDEPKALHVLLNWAGYTQQEQFDINQHREQQIDLLTDMLETHLKTEIIDDILEVSL
ncbi:MAG: cobyric acid synthase [Pseudomonadota bacterium]|nr:cobyric acid synthase [Pseudomonadota bacterium]